ncbi:MAG: DUF547 domain-containing protein [Oleiphilaceae bacterium]|nr:DUF547 domain-containing protein [Oleiphilaceae bacterium]
MSVVAQDQQLSQMLVTYQALLDAHLSAGSKNGKALNLLDYAELRKDERLEVLLEAFEAYPKERLDTRAKQIAFYLNAYNLLAMHKVAKHWPLHKLKDLGSFFRPVWTHHAGKVCGESMTLRKLEHEILRKLGDPRIHFALNCASVSCPDLRAEPYVAERLDAQLNEQTHIFLSQANKGMDIEGNQLILSPLFEWFAEDFEPSGGVLAFLKPYLPDTSEQWEIVGYFEYDWDVNDHLSAAEWNRIKRRGTWFN